MNLIELILTEFGVDVLRIGLLAGLIVCFIKTLPTLVKDVLIPLAELFISHISKSAKTKKQLETTEQWFKVSTLAVDGIDGILKDETLRESRNFSNLRKLAAKEKAKILGAQLEKICALREMQITASEKNKKKKKMKSRKRKEERKK